MADRTTMMTPKPTREPSLGELFFSFMKVGLSGFGGVIAWAHRMIVDQRRWMTEQEFIETLGFCQILPGPNIGNLSIYIGARFHGWRGSVAAFSGLMLIPFGLVLAAGALYAQFRDIAAVSGALDGVSAASAGLLLAMGIKMAMHIRRNAVAALFALAAFTGIGLLRLPFPLVLLVLAPLSVGTAWLRRP
jgi:chromate transporter